LGTNSVGGKASRGAVGMLHDDRLEEFIGFVACVLGFQGLDQSSMVSNDFSTLTLNDSVVGHLHTLPALITVHRVVTASNGRDLTVLLLVEEGEELLEVTLFCEDDVQ